MSIELKLAISALIIGATNLILRNNRNWVLGYRSRQAVRTHKSYAYANRIYGTAMFVIGLLYFIILIWFPDVYESWSSLRHLIWVIGYFVVVFLIIEILLNRVFRES